VYIVQDVARAEEARCDHVMHFELAVRELLSIGCCNCTANSVKRISVADYGTRLRLRILGMISNHVILLYLLCSWGYIVPFRVHFVV